MSDKDNVTNPDETGKYKKTQPINIDNQTTHKNERATHSPQSTSAIPPPAPLRAKPQSREMLLTRRKSRGGYMPPWWAFLLMLMFVGGAVMGLVILIIALGGRTPTRTQPQLVIYTAAPDLIAQSGELGFAEATIAPQTAPIEQQPQSAFVMDGPTLPAPLITPTPETVDVGKTIIVIDVGDQQLNVRDRPGIQAGVLFRAPESSLFIVTEGPIQADGLTWWRIQDPANGTRAGWSASNYLQPVPPEE